MSSFDSWQFCFCWQPPKEFRGNYFGQSTTPTFSLVHHCLHAYMLRRRFEAILKHLKFTNTQPPAFKHPFHPGNELTVAFNEHSQSCFSPGWVNCLDESMSVWTNQWTCPGWMFVPRKPHPMGNEYHSLCCGLSGIMYAIKLVEDKDRPRQLPPPK
jgi:hypothetical protein